MAELPLNLFLTTFLQQQHNIFLSLYELMLAQRDTDDKDWKNMLEQWASSVKQQLLQNKEKVLLFFDNIIFLAEESNLKKQAEELVSKFFEQANEALDSFFSKNFDLFSKTDASKSLSQLCDLWLSCNEACYQKMIFNKEYQTLYGNFINQILGAVDNSAWLAVNR